MLSIQRLNLTNFRSWEKVTIDFKPGITVINGRNGSGKTSLRMGLQYGLTGNIEKLTAKDIIREGTNNFKVEVETSIGKIIRSKGKNSFVDKEGAKRSIRDLSVLNTLRKIAPFIFLTPETSQFIDLTEAKRKELLSSLIEEIKIFKHDCYAKAREIKAHIDEKIVYLDSKIEVLSVQKMEVEDNLQSTTALLEKETEKLKKAEALKKVGRPMTEKEYYKTKKRIASLKAKCKELENKLRATELKEKSITSKLESITSYTVEIELEKNKIAGFEASIRDKENLLSGAYAKCPNCLEELVCANCSEKIVADKALLNKTKKEIVSLNGLLKASRKKVENLEKVWRKEKAKASKLDKVLNSLRETRDSLEEKLKTLQISIPELETAVEEYEKWQRAVEYLEKFSNKSLVKSLREKVKVLKKKDKKLKTELERIKRQRRILHNLSKDFNLLTSIYSTSLPELYYREFLQKFSKCVNMFANYLGGMSIIFQDIGDKLLTFIDGREYRKASTGEKQRAKIATTLGFSVLYTHADTIVFDEVFDLGLDEDGISALCVILQSVLKNIFSKIIIITHNKRLLEELQYDNLFLIEKDENSKTSTLITP